MLCHMSLWVAMNIYESRVMAMCPTVFKSQNNPRFIFTDHHYWSIFSPQLSSIPDTPKTIVDVQLPSLIFLPF